MSLDAIMNFALLVMFSLLPFAFYRVAKPGQDVATRLIGVDMMTNLLVGIVVLLAVIEGTNTTIDIGIAVAALSFEGTVSIDRYVSEGRVF